MATFQLTRHRIASAATVIAHLMLALVCTGRAEASCGDYLHSRHSLHKTSQFLPHLSETSVASTVDEADSHREPIVPATQPCSGPECGKAPLSIPLPVPVTGPGSKTDQHPAIFLRPRCEYPASTLHVGPRSRVRAVPGFPLPIDVPPELVC